MGAKECYCLAWDFEMDIRQRMASIEQEFEVKLHPVKIPREVMEKNRKPGSAVPWMEVAVLEAEVVVHKNKTVDIKLTHFLPVRLSSGADEASTLDALRNHLKHELPNFMMPRDIRVVAALRQNQPRDICPARCLRAGSDEQRREPSIMPDREDRVVRTTLRHVDADCAHRDTNRRPVSPTRTGARR